MIGKIERTKRPIETSQSVVNEAGKTSPIERLPITVLVNILLHLDESNDFAAADQVCHKWHTACAEPVATSAYRTTLKNEAISYGWRRAVPEDPEELEAGLTQQRRVQRNLASKQTFKQSTLRVKEERFQVNYVAQSPCGAFWALGCTDGVEIWNTAGKKPVRMKALGTRDRIFDLLFSPCGNWLTACGKERWYAWQYKRDGEIERCNTFYKVSQWGRVRFSPHGRYLAVAGGTDDPNLPVRLAIIEDWDNANYHPVLNEFTNQTAVLPQLAFTEGESEATLHDVGGPLISWSRDKSDDGALSGFYLWLERVRDAGARTRVSRQVEVLPVGNKFETQLLTLSGTSSPMQKTLCRSSAYPMARLSDDGLKVWIAQGRNVQIFDLNAPTPTIWHRLRPHFPAPNIA